MVDILWSAICIVSAEALLISILVVWQSLHPMDELPHWKPHNYDVLDEAEKILEAAWAKQKDL